MSARGFIWLAFLLSGCGHSSASMHPATNDDVHAIQENEALLTRSSIVARDGESSCDARCRACASAVAAASDICATAESVSDSDVRTRCEDARGVAAEVRSEVGAHCECMCT